MRLKKITMCMLSIAFVQAAHIQPAQAQIISQTPRPEIINPEELPDVETLKREIPIGSHARSILVPRTGALLFASFDRNSDYVIDRDEVRAGIAASFKNADRNLNGRLSLVELEGWRVRALGSENATPTNYAFAPNFVRTVTFETFSAVLSGVAENLDKDFQDELDGEISMADLLKHFAPPRARNNKGESCVERIRQTRREVEQQCRTRGGY